MNISEPPNNNEQNARAEQLIADAMMSNRVFVGHIIDRPLFRYMVIRNWISPVFPHVILPAGLKMMDSVRPYPSSEQLA